MVSLKAMLLMRAGHKMAGRGAYEAAVEKYREAVTREPEMAQALAHLALAYAAVADYPHAVETAQRAIELARGEAAIFVLAGIALLDADDVEGADRAFAEARRLNPENDLAAKYGLLVAWMRGDASATSALSSKPLPDSQRFLARVLWQTEMQAAKAKDDSKH
jgi:tetratricopeptide (TPR) repeat protein